MTGPWPTIAFIGFILFMLALDLGVFNRKSHEVKPKEAALWVSVWVALAGIFNWGVYHFLGFEKGLQFTTGYLIEQTLSVDNMFVFVMLMSAFKVPKEKQHKLLFFGVLGAIVMRGILIAAGVALIHQFHWLFYVFGAFLIYTAFRMATENEQVEFDPEKNPVLRFLVQRFRGATPFTLALICLELTDLLFAMDSIPAIFAITDDPFILFTSNIFAILGLRSLYFLVAHAVGKFHLLKYGIALVLGFVGVKMVTREVVEMPMVWSLAFIVVVIAVSVALSLYLPDTNASDPDRGTKPSA